MLKNKFINFLEYSLKVLKKYWHIIALVILSLIPLLWFLGRGEAIINGVDTNFPLNPKLWLIRRFYMWNNLSNGGSDFSFAPAGIFFHVIQFIPYVLGLPLQLTEKISMIFWFGIIVVNSYIFAGNFVKNKLLKIMFVTLYALNIYMFNSWENVKVANLSLVAGIPLLLHIFINLKDNLITKGKALIFLFFTSLILSGAGINPAYFIAAMLSLFVFAVISFIIGENFKNILKSFIFVVLAIIIFSSYWIIPTTSFVTRTVSQSSSIGSIGFNNWVDSLSENTSIMNVLRLQGAWDWYVFDSVSKEPLYLPYTPNYFYKLPFIVYSFLIPALAIASLFFAKNKKTKFHLYFLCILIVGVFLGSGSHEPTGTLFKFLGLHLPYFSLFRSPWYIFTPLLTIALAGLVALLFDNFKPNKVIYTLALLIIFGNIVYCYPLITGRVFRPSKPNGFFVNFPEYVFDAGNDLSKITKNRTLSYPDDQLEKFDWGYVGVEPVINLFSNNEMVFSAINNTESSFSRIVTSLYKSIKNNDTKQILNLSRKLNINVMLEKNDQQTLSDQINVDKNWQTSKYQNWMIHKIDQSISSDNKIVLANDFYTSFGEENNSVEQLAYLNANEHLVLANDTVINSIPLFGSSFGKIVSAKNTQYEKYLLNNYKIIDPGYTIYNFSVPEDGIYNPVLEKRDVLISKGVVTFINGSDSINWKVKNIDESNIYFEEIYLKRGDYSYKYQTSKNLVLENDLSTLENVNINNKYTNFDIPDLDYRNPYLVSFEYDWSFGSQPSVLVSQKNNETMLQTKKIDLPKNYHMSQFGFYFMPVDANSTAFISILNRAEDNLVDYKNLKVYKLFTNKLILIKSSSPQSILAGIKFEKVSPIKYIGSVVDVKNPQTLIFAENYTNGWKLKITDLNGKKIRYRADHFTADFYANAWYIDTAGQDFKFEIYYDPQKYFVLGLFLTLSAILGAVLYNLYTNSKK